MNNGFSKVGMLVMAEKDQMIMELQETVQVSQDYSLACSHTHTVRGSPHCHNDTCTCDLSSRLLG